jgi:hypothetical protein
MYFCCDFPQGLYFRVFERLTLNACTVQVASTIQTTTMPYWNEILQINIPSPLRRALPSLVSICLETWIPHDPSSKEVAEFEVFLTPSLEIGMGEAKLVAIKTWCTSTSPSTSAFVRGGTTMPTLRVTCSLDRDLVAARQQGLWPLIKQGGNILKAAPMQRIGVPEEPDFPLLMHPDVA